MALEFSQQPFFEAFGVEAVIGSTTYTVILLEDEDTASGVSDRFSHSDYEAAIQIQEADKAAFIEGDPIVVDDRNLRIFDTPRQHTDGSWRVNLEP